MHRPHKIGGQHRQNKKMKHGHIAHMILVILLHQHSSSINCNSQPAERPRSAGVPPALTISQPTTCTAHARTAHSNERDHSGPSTRKCSATRVSSPAFNAAECNSTSAE